MSSREKLLMKKIKKREKVKKELAFKQQQQKATFVQAELSLVPSSKPELPIKSVWFLLYSKMLGFGFYTIQVKCLCNF